MAAVRRDGMMPMSPHGALGTESGRHYQRGILKDLASLRSDCSRSLEYAVRDAQRVRACDCHPRRIARAKVRESWSLH